MRFLHTNRELVDQCKKNTLKAITLSFSKLSSAESATLEKLELDLFESLKVNTSITHVVVSLFVTKNQYEAMCNSLIHNTAVKILTLCKIEACPVLEEMLGVNQSIVAVTLSNCQQLDAVAFSFLCAGLCRNKSIRTLMCVSTPITLERAKVLCEVFPLNRTIQTLSLSGCQLQEDSMAIVCGALAESSTVTSVDLSGNLFNVRIFQIMIKWLKRARSIKELSLKNCDMGAESAAELGKGLSACHLLSKLDVSSNMLTSTGLASICGALKDNQSFQIVSFSSCGLVAKDIPFILNTVGLHLTSLDISQNLIDVEGMLELCQYLKVNKTLRTLYSCNNFHASGNIGSLLADALKENSTLIHLGIWDLGPSIVHVTSVLAAHNKHLQSFGFVLNQTYSLDFDQVWEFLEKNKSLTELKICMRNLGPKPAESFAKALRSNTSLLVLEYLDLGKGKKVERSLAQAVELGNIIFCTGCGDDATAVASAKRLSLMTAVRMCALTLLAIRWFRESCLSQAPKELVQMIAVSVWTTREDVAFWKVLGNDSKKSLFMSKVKSLLQIK